MLLLVLLAAAAVPVSSAPRPIVAIVRPAGDPSYCLTFTNETDGREPPLLVLRRCAHRESAQWFDLVDVTRVTSSGGALHVPTHEQGGGLDSHMQVSTKAGVYRMSPHQRPDYCAAVRRDFGKHVVAETCDQNVITTRQFFAFGAKLPPPPPEGPIPRHEEHMVAFSHRRCVAVDMVASRGMDGATLRAEPCSVRAIGHERQGQRWQFDVLRSVAPRAEPVPRDWVAEQAVHAAEVKRRKAFLRDLP